MTPAPERVAAFYGRWAALYDRIAAAPGVGKWRQAAADRIAGPGDTVVEMGCGTGVNLPYLRERVGPNGRVVGIDITGPLLERARERAAGYQNVDVIRGDATAPPIREADAVLATFVCGLLSDPAAVVDRWCDLVGPGGRVAVLDATASDDPRGRALTRSSERSSRRDRRPTAFGTCSARRSAGGQRFSPGASTPPGRRLPGERSIDATTSSRSGSSVSRAGPSGPNRRRTIKRVHPATLPRIVVVRYQSSLRPSVSVVGGFGGDRHLDVGAVDAEFVDRRLRGAFA